MSNKFKPDYDFLTRTYDTVNFYNIVRELQNREREELYDSDILYCMVKAAKEYHQSQLQSLKEEVENIEKEHPLALQHGEDTRYIWPKRWKEMKNLITNLEG